MKTTTTETSIPEEKTTSARIQAYSKSQLAALYLPHIQPASARRTLRSWIAKNTELQAALARSGYTGFFWKTLASHPETIHLCVPV